MFYENRKYKLDFHQTTKNLDTMNIEVMDTTANRVRHVVLKSLANFAQIYSIGGVLNVTTDGNNSFH